MTIPPSVVLPFYVVLMVMYVLQWFAAAHLSQQKRSVIGPDDKAFTIKVWVASLKQNGGLRNIWGLLVLVVFVPIVFASLEEIKDLISNDTMTIAPFLRTFCMSTIVVLITLEFAYIYNFRDKIGEWTTMLLSALALDFATLMLFILTAGDKMFDAHPAAAQSVAESTFEQRFTTEAAEFVVQEVGAESRIIFMSILTLFAFVATFTILVFSKTEVILASGKVDFIYVERKESQDIENNGDEPPPAPKVETARGGTGTDRS